jgi:hypothetical protein
MLRNGIIFAAICLLPAIASAQARGPWELTLGGTGANSSRFDGFSAAVEGSIGYFFTDMLEVSVRQNLTFTDIGPKQLNGATRIALDLHFPLGDQGQFVPFIGANGGYVYGDSVNDTWELAPEGGIKVFISNTSFIFGTIEYEWFLNRHSGSGVAFHEGTINYTLGIGARV